MVIGAKKTIRQYGLHRVIVLAKSANKTLTLLILNRIIALILTV